MTDMNGMPDVWYYPYKMHGEWAKYQPKGAQTENFECLLMNHYAMGEAHTDLWRAIRDRPNKLYVAPPDHSVVMPLLNVREHIEVTKGDAWKDYQRVVSLLLDMEPSTVLFSAGPTSKAIINAVRHIHSCIDVGSALDPLVFGKTRTPQATPEEAENFRLSLCA
jgi:hypothetical protein